ncbi:MAG: hypothetical protein R2941_21870 [Desulfobacterales bacterium]
MRIWNTCAGIKAFAEKKYANGDKKPEVKIFEENDGPPTGKPVNIRVTALTLDDAIHASDAILAYMREESEMDALIDLDDDRPEMQQVVKFHPRQESVSEYGLAPGQVTAMTATALNGYPAGKFRQQTGKWI